jgi:hypothetical protein
MGSLASKTAADGTARSTISQILDPAGLCLQPADIKPFAGRQDIDVPAATTECFVDAVEPTFAEEELHMSPLVIPR